MRWKFFVGFLFLSATSSSGQSTIDSLRAFYVQEYPDKFFIWPVLKHRSLNFKVRDSRGEDPGVEFKPNSTSSFGFGLYLFDVGFEITFAIPLEEKQKETFGESEVRDLQVNLLTKSWGIDVYSQKYSGFYKNDLRIKGTLIDGAKRPDIDTRNFGVSGFYIFNNKQFSYRSSYNFAERQLRKRGSLIVYGTLNSFKVHADSAILAPSTRVGFKDGSDFEDLEYTTLSLAPGYSYNLVIKKLFLNGTLTVGPAHHWVYYQKETNEKKYDVSFNATYSVRLAVGYNSDRIFGGIGLVFQTRAVKFEDVRFENSSNTARIIIGYRFTEKGILKKRLWDFIPFLTGR